MWADFIFLAGLTIFQLPGEEQPKVELEERRIGMQALS